MSGINGIISRIGQEIQPHSLKKMNDITAHRGPDKRQYWAEGKIGLGQCMLMTTPESKYEDLPFHWKKHDLAITADARIDNREELIEALKITKKAQSIPDSEIILRSYQKWGEKCPGKLIGDFAFTIWDGEKDEVFCARDHMGVKPFYYHLNHEDFIFSSEIKAISCILGINEINEDQIANFLTAYFEDRQSTFYKEIYRLPAAHYLIIKEEDHELKRYWKLDPEKEIKLESDEEYKNKFLEIFTEAVKCRLRSYLPVGSMLSGGMDSSSIVCTAKRLIKDEPFYTFSNIFDQVPESDEREYINSILSKNDLKHYFILADEISPLKDFNNVMWYEEEPFFGPNLFLTWSVYAEAQKHVRVILSGFDGDTTLHKHGAGFLMEYFLKFRYHRLIKEVTEVSKIFKISPSKLLMNALLPLIHNQINSLKAILGKEETWKHRGIINKDFAEKRGIYARLKEMDREEYGYHNSKYLHYFFLKTGLLQSALELHDKASAAFSIETRYPFFDKRLIEFCLALPPEQKLQNGWDRIILRRAMTNILPEKVQWRKEKSDLSPIFSRNLLLFEKTLIEKILYEEFQTIDKYVDLDKIRTNYDLINKNKIITCPQLWQVISIYCWLNNQQTLDPAFNG